MRIAYLYIGSSISIILIILLILQFKSTPQHKPKIKYKVLLDTPKGLKQISNRQAADELANIKKMLNKRKLSANNSCARLVPLIKSSMQNLTKFINQNPHLNSNALCNLEIRSDIINQSMQNNLKPNGNSDFKTILDWEEQEHRMTNSTVERMEYLIRNLDIVIKMLRANVCDYGRLNLSKLYHILLELNKLACGDPHKFPIMIKNGKFKYKKIPVRSLIEFEIEPMQSRETFMNKPVNINTIHHESLPSGIDNLLRKRMNYKLNHGSIEGSIEKDILEHKPLGYTFGQVEKKEKYYTTNVNSCLGESVDDNEQWNKCTAYDARALEAINGQPQYLISDLQD